MSGRVLVNVGCGRVWHRDWLNLDHRPTAPEIQAFDLRKPLPFADGTVDAVYASHVLEHLDLAEGRRLLSECRRILKPGGIVRIVVPDFEDLCRFYLQRLASVAERPNADNELAYDWAYLQLLDQHVRRRGGGELMAYLDRPGLLTNPALDKRLSREIQILVQERTAHRPADGQATRAGAGFGLRRVRTSIRKSVMSAVRKMLPNSVMEGLETALFLRTGEVHRVGYDRFSLPRLLRQVGFDEVAVVGASQSRIPGFNAAELDCVDGVPRKPGSLFVEAVRKSHDNVAKMPPQRTIEEAAA